MDSKRYSAPTARPIIRAAWYGVDVRTCGMMDRAVGPWWLLRMVSWGDAPSWDGMGPLARKNPPASRAIWIVRPSSAPTAHRHPSPGIAQTWLKNQQSSVDNHQSNLSEKIRGISVISGCIPPNNPANFRIRAKYEPRGIPALKHGPTFARR
jgi:hypothetical protein